MIKTKWRYVVASSTGQRVLFGARDHTVVVHDLASGTQSDTIDTTFDLGGRRLALSDELNGVLAGAYSMHGLAFHSCSTGAEVWRRKDIDQIQYINLSRDGRIAYCCTEESPLIVLDVGTGETIRSIDNALSLHDSPFDNVQFLNGTPPQLVSKTGRLLFNVDRTTFAILDFAFAPGLLVLTESGGPVRCIDLETGGEQWRYEPPKGSHVLTLGYREDEPCILGIEDPYEDGGPDKLLQFSVDHGTILGTFDLGEVGRCCFALAGKVIVTTEGKIFDTVSGRMHLIDI